MYKFFQKTQVFYLGFFHGFRAEFYIYKTDEFSPGIFLNRWIWKYWVFSFQRYQNIDFNPYKKLKYSSFKYKVRIFLSRIFQFSYKTKIFMKKFIGYRVEAPFRPLQRRGIWKLGLHLLVSIDFIVSWIPKMQANFNRLNKKILLNKHW